MKTLRLDQGSSFPDTKDLYDSIIDHGFLQSLPRSERSSYLKKIKTLLSVDGIFQVQCTNRRFLETVGSPGEKALSTLLYFNEFITLLAQEFSWLEFQGKKPNLPNITSGMSEHDEYFLAFGHLKEQETKPRVLVMAESEAQLFEYLTKLQSRGYHPEGISLHLYQEIVYHKEFRIHRLRGLAQLLVTTTLVKPEAILLPRNLTNINLFFDHKKINLVHSLEDLEMRKPNMPVLQQKTASNKIGVIWEGTFFAHHSLSHVNEEVALALDKEKINLSLIPYEAPQFLNNLEQRLRRIVPCFHEIAGQVDFHVRHHWPPNWEEPLQGELVVMQPWEFGSLPAYWLRSLENVREIWAYTHFVRDTYVRSGVPPDRVHVIPLGIDPEIFSPEGPKLPLKTEKKFRFLYVGGMIMRKGFDLLIKAYLQEFKPDEDVCLVIRDFYYQSEWKAQIESLTGRNDLPEVILFSDSLLPEQLPSLFRACHVSVQPYRGEGFGLPTLEAMACGLPPIVTGYGAGLDFCHSGNAYLVPARLTLAESSSVDTLHTIDTPFLAEPDVPALRRAMRHTFANHRETVHRGLLAAGEVRQDWTWKRTGERVLERLHALKGRKPEKLSINPPVSTTAYVESYNESPQDLQKSGCNSVSFNIWNAHANLEESLIDSESYFQKLLQLPQWKAEGLYGLARVAIQRRQEAEALQFLETTVEVSPFHSLAWLDLALLAQKVGDADKAVLAALEARKKFPENPLSPKPKGSIKEEDKYLYGGPRTV